MGHRAGEPRDGVDGSADGPAQRAAQLMREPPPTATLKWLIGELDASEVVDVSPMPGGSTSAMHRVTLIDHAGRERTVVVRRYVRAEVIATKPDVATVEARALELAERLPVPTPVLLALDAHGDQTGVPTVVMTLLDGRPVWETRWSSRWVSQAVDAMIVLHDVDASQVALPALSTYAQKRYDPPRWTTNPDLWEQAVELFHGPMPTCDIGFIQYSQTMADDVRTTWEERSGLSFDPWADLASIIGTLDNVRGRQNHNAATWSIEAALNRAVADLT